MSERTGLARHHGDSFDSSQSAARCITRRCATSVERSGTDRRDLLLELLRVGDTHDLVTTDRQIILEPE
jgi:hypothetical protein